MAEEKTYKKENFEEASKLFIEVFNSTYSDVQMAEQAAIGLGNIFSMKSATISFAEDIFDVLLGKKKIEDVKENLVKAGLNEAEIGKKFFIAIRLYTCFKAKLGKANVITSKTLPNKTNFEGKAALNTEAAGYYETVLEQTDNRDFRAEASLGLANIRLQNKATIKDAEKLFNDVLKMEKAGSYNKTRAKIGLCEAELALAPEGADQNTLYAKQLEIKNRVITDLRKIIAENKDTYLTEVASLDLASLLAQRKETRDEAKQIYERVINGTVAKSKLLPKYNAHEKALGKIFNNIKDDILVFKPKMTIEQIREILPKDAPKELLDLLQQSLDSSKDAHNVQRATLGKAIIMLQDDKSSPDAKMEALADVIAVINNPELDRNIYERAVIALANLLANCDATSSISKAIFDMLIDGSTSVKIGDLAEIKGKVDKGQDLTENEKSLIAAALASQTAEQKPLITSPLISGLKQTNSDYHMATALVARGDILSRKPSTIDAGT
ncbi:MAG: hypothetical protein AABZ57_02170, partial [Candidatus Margulisiibacteriota bacterium]